jgi:hypothetical protein
MFPRQAESLPADVCKRTSSRLLQSKDNAAAGVPAARKTQPRGKHLKSFGTKDVEVQSVAGYREAVFLPYGLALPTRIGTIGYPLGVPVAEQASRLAAAGSKRGSSSPTPTPMCWPSATAISCGSSLGDGAAALVPRITTCFARPSGDRVRRFGLLAESDAAIN